jgi:alkylation response protein AidB-like acyl-CoA dehydrogenase
MPIIQHQAIGVRLAEMATKIEAARLLTYKAATLVDEGKMDPMATAMAKDFAASVAMEATNAAIQTLGGYGYLGEYRVEKYHRDAKITEHQRFKNCRCSSTFLASTRKGEKTHILYATNIDLE